MCIMSNNVNNYRHTMAYTNIPEDNCRHSCTLSYTNITVISSLVTLKYLSSLEDNCIHYCVPWHILTYLKGFLWNTNEKFLCTYPSFNIPGKSLLVQNCRLSSVLCHTLFSISFSQRYHKFA